MSLGIYISVPFCRTKCSFCNFASGVFSRAVFDRYVDQVCTEIAAADAIACGVGGKLERQVDSIYLGGGTPSVLAPDQLERLFQTLRDNFDVERTAEITVECAPGTITEPVLEGVAELWCQSRQPWRAVVRGQRMFVGRTPAQSRRHPGRHRTFACRRHWQYRHRLDCRVASSDRRQLGLFA